MGDGAVSPGTMLEAQPDSAIPMDFDYINELFLDGCWLETTTDGSDFVVQSPSSSNPLFDPSFPWPALDNNGGAIVIPSRNGNQKEKPSTLFNESQETPFNNQSVSQDIINVAASSSTHNEIYSVEGFDEVRRWWIGPTANPGPGLSVMERLIKALIYIKDLNRDKDLLIQIWVPVNREGKRILKTNDLLFTLGTSCARLAKYRDISEKFQFAAEEDDKRLVLGLPGRVFRGKVPEWTPDVRLFRSDEYPRVDHAQEYDVRGTLALPVFEQGSRTCLGVIEVVLTEQQIKYRPELESVCKALEAVNLRSSKLPSIQDVKACNRSYEAALPEIKEVLRSACEIHKLPLAQTWVPCIQQGKEGSRHTEDNFFNCVSPVDQACYVGDLRIHGFHEACCEHHLLKGQGIAGEAFTTNQPCFSTDVTSSSKTDYPLSHHAKLFGLRAAVAIRLRSIHSSTDDFVLEFFLPTDCTDGKEQKKVLTSLSMIIQQVCHSVRVITSEEVEEEKKLSAATDSVSARTPNWMELQRSGMVAETSSEKIRRKFSDIRHQQDDSNSKGNLDSIGEFSTFAENSSSSGGLCKTGEKRRTKADKNITLEVLQQYFAGSLKDAAKNIGVCTTTLKRICRQHGIKRWPSRKIKKVGHSLQKLQLVMDSVQGSSGAFQIDTFYSNFPELASPNLTRTSVFSTAKQGNNPNPSSTEQEPALLSAEVVAIKSPSSSSSQTSISSHSCFSVPDQHLHTGSVLVGKDPTVREDSGDGGLKRVRSEAELKQTSHGDGKEVLPRSQSQELVGEDQKIEFLRSLSKNNAKMPRKVDSHRVKVTYGEEKARFRMPKNWNYEDLVGEIGRRFNINDMSKFDIKYLDDDSEWVLLTCDADLEECIDICHCQSSESRTIKLSLHVSNYFVRTSLGSGGIL